MKLEFSEEFAISQLDKKDKAKYDELDKECQKEWASINEWRRKRNDEAKKRYAELNRKRKWWDLGFIYDYPLYSPLDPLFRMAEEFTAREIEGRIRRLLGEGLIKRMRK